ncbi:IS4 family transposase, partial [Acinetobacter baumannii]
VQRKSKFTASDFVSLCAFLTDDLSTKSLTRLCSQLDAERNLSMSTEGLNQRFNPDGVTFLQKLFSALLREKIGFHSP